jgi:hypothetical protein
MTKGELKSMVSTVMKDLLREAVVEYMSTYAGRGIVDDELRKLLAGVIKTDYFKDLLAIVVKNDMTRVRSLIEDAALNVYVSKRKDNPSGKPTGRNRKRTVRL